MLWFCQELDRRDRVLARMGWFQIALLALMLVAMVFDHRTLLGLNVWIKPSKFAVSIAIYVWTLAWFMPYLTGVRWAKALIRWGTVVAMVTEIVCIAGQAARGKTSHFNHDSEFDGNVFGMMGLAIAFSTLLDVLLLILFFVRNVPLATTYLWGIRCGIFGAILAAGVGVMMAGNGAHSVAGQDGGPGLPIVNWSTQSGDLRVAHALLLHALQILPLAGFALSRARKPATPRGVMAGFVLLTTLYALLCAAMFRQAVAGRSLVGRYFSVTEQSETL
ncbi:MAG TPA: hypothetical protein VGG64_20495 [Pirellulales bacterium]|jgi:hypothetical protein